MKVSKQNGRMAVSISYTTYQWLLTYKKQEKIATLAGAVTDLLVKDRIKKTKAKNRAEGETNGKREMEEN